MNLIAQLAEGYLHHHVRINKKYEGVLWGVGRLGQLYIAMKGGGINLPAASIFHFEDLGVKPAISKSLNRRYRELVDIESLKQSYFEGNKTAFKGWRGHFFPLQTTLEGWEAEREEWKQSRRKERKTSLRRKRARSDHMTVECNVHL